MKTFSKYLVLISLPMFVFSCDPEETPVDETAISTEEKDFRNDSGEEHKPPEVREDE